MELNNLTPFAPFIFDSLDETDKPTHVIVCRATFDLVDDSSIRISSQQQGVIVADEYRGEPLSSSVRHESDLAPRKYCADVTLNATAFSPHNTSCDSWLASVRVGKIESSVRVTGPRFWKHSWSLGWHLTEPERADCVPIHYEFAFGGCSQSSNNVVVYEENPVGRGFVLSPEKVSKNLLVPAPQIEFAQDPAVRFGHSLPLAGWGPIAKCWLPRRQLCGTADDKWKAERWPLRPLDFNFNYYNCAPPQLRYPGFLAGNEEVLISGCSRTADISFRLPGIGIAAVAVEKNLTVVPLALVLDTLSIDLELQTVGLVWRISFPKTDELVSVHIASYSL